MLTTVSCFSNQEILEARSTAQSALALDPDFVFSCTPDGCKAAPAQNSAYLLAISSARLQQRALELFGSWHAFRTANRDETCYREQTWQRSMFSWLRCTSKHGATTVLTSRADSERRATAIFVHQTDLERCLDERQSRVLSKSKSLPDSLRQHNYASLPSGDIRQ